MSDSLVTEPTRTSRLRGLWTHPDFVKLWTGQTISQLGTRISREGIPLTAVLVLHAGTAIQILHLRPAVLGVVIALGGVGAMVGSVVAPRIVRRFGLGATFIATSAVHGLTNLLIPLAGLVGTPGTTQPLAVAFLMVPQLFGDTAFMIYFINELTLRQQVAPEHVLGRVNAGMQLLARGVWPIGALIGGALAAVIGVRATLAMGAAGVVLSTFWLLASPLPRLR
jgi:predicted MFS family arabinose efflux permease